MSASSANLCVVSEVLSSRQGRQRERHRASPRVVTSVPPQALTAAARSVSTRFVTPASPRRSSASAASRAPTRCFQSLRMGTLLYIPWFCLDVLAFLLIYFQTGTTDLQDVITTKLGETQSNFIVVFDNFAEKAPLGPYRLMLKTCRQMQTRSGLLEAGGTL